MWYDQVKSIKEVHESNKDEQVKKGRSLSWKPAKKLGDIKNVPEGHTARWCDKDPANIDKKLQEGWEFINKTTAPSVVHESEDKTREVVDSNYDLDSAITYRELVGMALPDDLKEARAKYFEQRTIDATKARIKGTEAKRQLGAYADSVREPELTIHD